MQLVDGSRELLDKLRTALGAPFILARCLPQFSQAPEPLYRMLEEFNSGQAKTTLTRGGVASLYGGSGGSILRPAEPAMGKYILVL